VGRLKREPAKTAKQREREDEEEDDQKHEHLNGHNDPHCLKLGEERALVFLELTFRLFKAKGSPGLPETAQ
jgi:hypothetical protein